MSTPRPSERTANLDSAAEQLGISREELMTRLQQAGINLAARKIKTLTASEIEKIRNMK